MVVRVLTLLFITAVAGCTAVPQPTDTPSASHAATAAPSPVSRASEGASPWSAPLETEWELIEFGWDPPWSPMSFSGAAASTERLVVVGDEICDAPEFDFALSCNAGIWTAPIDDPTALDAIPAQDDLSVGNAHPIIGQRPGTVDVVAGPHGFVAIGYRGMATTPLEAVIWWSSDGLIWQVAEVGDALDGARPVAVAEGGPGYVIVGSVHDPAAPRAAAWASADGRSWERVRDTEAFEVGGYVNTGEIPIAGGMTSITHYPGGLLAFGSRCVGGGTLSEPGPLGGPDSCRFTSWTSDDGLAWRQSKLVLDATVAVHSVAVTDGRLVAVGSSGLEGGQQPPVGVSFVSRDGTTWEAGSSEGLSRLDVAVAVPGGVMALGTDGGVLRAWTSADGIEWDEVASLPPIENALVIRDIDAVLAGDNVVVVGWAEVRRNDPFVSFVLVGPATHPPR
ncbi:MAG: hypothetical protein ACRDG7_08725 [Candidatus Limnocylindria bacterium]